MAKDISIRLHVSEIVYEVRNKTWLAGRSALNGNNHEHVAHMQASDDEEDENQITRSIINAMSVLKTAVGEYVLPDSQDQSANILDKHAAYDFVLKMPNNYNESLRATLSAAMHQYVVAICVRDWYMLTNKEDAQTYDNMATSQLGIIKEALTRRVRPTYTAP